MKVIWERRALSDLRRIQLYIARDNATAARRWVKQLIDRARTTVEHPLAGRRVPELEREDIREVFVKSYRIIYRVTDSAIRVLTVIQGHRQMPDDAVSDDEGES